MIGVKDKAKEKAQQEGVRRVKDWLIGLLPADEKEEDDGGTAEDGKETSVIVNQLACKEAGCPDVEVVITLLRAKPRPKLMFKIYKAASELTSDEVGAAMQKATADEQEELAAATKVAHDHDHDAQDHGHAHGIGDDCGCGESHETEHVGHEGHVDKREKHNHEQDETVEHSHAP